VTVERKYELRHLSPNKTIMMAQVVERLQSRLPNQSLTVSTSTAEPPLDYLDIQRWTDIWYS